MPRAAEHLFLRPMMCLCGFNLVRVDRSEDGHLWVWFELNYGTEAGDWGWWGEDCVTEKMYFERASLV